MSQAGPPGPPPGPPPPPRSPGPPRGPAPDESPGGGNVDRRRLGWIIAAIAVVAAVVVAVVLASQSGDDDQAADAQQVLLEPATTDGPFPWTGSVAHEDAPTSVPLPPTSTPGATTTGSSPAG